ncbi:exosortase family protein XrtF [Flavobacterium sp. H122]|uniref:exosortase family protein XrtF n=1 Tax=Flavobacterium sp. H122 TaxID=2529860 RepID=UPI0010A9B2F1|nr:exosortase family protein XrtF [Flavobacterium sp. H122]
MKTLFQQYRPFLLFLGKFFLSYLLLSVLYRFYLSQVSDDAIDGITANVSKTVRQAAQWLGISIETRPGFMAYEIIYQGKSIARIIEGCNGTSVIILFTAFIIAFSGKLKATLIYVLLGSVVIYVLNIVRIICLTALLYKFPQFEHFLHGVLFPAVIYGIVFLLWLFWIKNYSKYAS